MPHKFLIMFLKVIRFRQIINVLAHHQLFMTKLPDSVSTTRLCHNSSVFHQDQRSVEEDLSDDTDRQWNPKFLPGRKTIRTEQLWFISTTDDINICYNST